MGLLLLSAVCIFIYYYIEAKRLTFEESAVNLGEVSRQLSDSIKQQCDDRWKTLSLMDNYLRAAKEDGADRTRFFEQAKQQWGFDSVCLVDKNSTYYDDENTFSLLTQRDVTERLISGREQVILDDVIYGNTRQLIFLLPIEDLTVQNFVFQAVGLRYGSGNIFDILSIGAFGDQSDLYIVHKDGTTLYRSTQGPGIDGYNLYNSLESYEFARGSVRELRDGGDGDSRLMTVHQGDGLYYINQRAIDVGDWKLVMMVPVEAVSGSMNRFSWLSGLCLGTVAVLLLTAAALFYTDFMKRSLRAEEKARQAAESANRSKSQFLSSMSHDIRTPMNAVVGMAHIAENNLDNPEKVRECLARIRLSGQLLVGLINDILDMSKIESGKMVLNMESASLNKLLDGIVNIIQPMAREKRQTFYLRMNHVYHEQLYFDSLRLSQVILNLLSNALKFTPEGGNIEVDVTEEGITDQGLARFSFRVSDNGIGMEAKFVEEIFDAFSREQDSRVNRIEGSGLGMAITKRIVDMMGGTIEVDSTPGKGSVFTVGLDFRIDGTAEEELTLLPSEKAAQEQKEESVPDFSGRRVLLVEDNEVNREIAEELLRSMGIEVESACDGAQGLKAFDESAVGYYDAVLMDIQMPVMNGYQATEAIRRLMRPDAAGIPIIAMTADAFAEDVANARAAGMTAHLAKPLDIPVMMRMLSKYLVKEQENRL